MQVVNYYITNDYPMIGMFISLAIGLFIVILIIWGLYEKSYFSDSVASKYTYAIVAMILSIGTIVGCIAAINGIIKANRERKHFEYEVIISDDYSLKDFTEQYEIVRQRGQIYVIKEKEKE